MQEPEKQAFVIRAIDSIGTFRAYLSRVFQQGNSAENALAAHEATRDEILEEDLDEGDIH